MMTSAVVQLTSLLFFLACVIFTSNAQGCPTNQCTCDGNVINCRNKGLTQIPTFTSTGVFYDEITFSSSEETGCVGCNNITSLPAGAFVNLQVKKIDLTKNAIATVDNNAFQGLEQYIQELRLEGSGSVEPPYTAIQSLSGLTNLYLENYRQTLIGNNNIFGNFANLQHLTLAKFLELTQIDSGAFTNKLPQLKELFLQSIPFITLPAGALLQLSGLETLEIADTDIQRIFGVSFSAFNHLKNLHITRNSHLHTIDDLAFEGIRDTLEFLLLTHNALRPGSSMGSLRHGWPKLAQLNIGYNSLGSIPSGTFANMTALSYLNLNYINLDSLDASFLQGLTNLRALDVSDNLISSIQPSTFTPCPKLTELKLGLQTISGSTLTIPPSAFNGMAQSLNTFTVENQNLDTSVLWETIATLTGLIHLDLSATGLTTIPDYSFRNNGRLQILALAYNGLNTLKQEMFYGIRQLQTIDLQNTNIQTIDQCVFDDFSNLDTIYLSGNDLTCDCGVLWLYDWIKSKTIINEVFPYIVGASCSPTSTSLTDLDRNVLCAPPVLVPVTCPNLYTTAASPQSTTSTTTTTTTTQPTTVPVPAYSLDLTKQDSFSVLLFWTITDPSRVTRLILDQIVNGELTSILISKEKFTFRLPGLEPSTGYTWCLYLEIDGVKREAESQCRVYQTPDGTTMPTTQMTAAPEPLTDTQLIIGLSVGGGILIILVLAILYILIKIKKPKRTPIEHTGVFYEPKKVDSDGGAAGFGQPRHFIKGGKGGAAKLDDIDIKVVSNGKGMDKERMSAGSYQFLNDTGKDVQNQPMPSTSKGHYANSVEDRPLPQMPYGQKSVSTISDGKGYVNDAFHGSSNPLPETSKNSYSEVRY